MQHLKTLIQQPAPGTRTVRFCGDTLAFSLTVPSGLKGSAWIRTNIGHAAVTRREIIRNVHFQETPLGRDWFDTPMPRVAENRFEVNLALCEVGHFEAKCFFLEEAQISPVWPAGPNTCVNVQSSESYCANTIYNAFVRQFGANKSGQNLPSLPVEECVRLLDAEHYTVIPPSGTFRDLIAELDFILGKLGCRILMLLPIHPTPTTYGRMGRFGSPYAALSFRNVDPALAVFDPKATPTEQFIELVDAVHRRNGRLFLDIAINHTGWAANLHTNHPEWLVRTPEGRIEVPGAWGVQWEDLTKLDYRHQELWRFMAAVFLTWCRRGVDGFRCDAGYMIPHAAWKYIVAQVRDQFPDTTFLLEGLGGKIAVTRELLNTANLDWAYSELFQNYDRSQIEHYLPQALDIAATDGLMVNLAETHDNPRLAAISHAYARMRTALCALSSLSGAFGFANGVEWLAAEKINVHESVPLNWNAPVNLVKEIRRLNLLLKFHPAFCAQTEVSLIEQGGGNHLVLLRRHLPTDKRLLVLVNLDCERSTQAAWNPEAAGLPQRNYIDLLAETSVEVQEAGGRFTCTLEAGQVRCLSADLADLERLNLSPTNSFAVPPFVEHQLVRAKALQVITYCRRSQNAAGLDIDRAAAELKTDPAAFCAQLNATSTESRVVTWRWPRDLDREVMIPPDHFLLLKCTNGFRAQLLDKDRTLAVEKGMRSTEGSFFCLFLPVPPPRQLKRLTLRITAYEETGNHHAEASLLLLPNPDTVRVKRVFTRKDLLKKPLVVLGTNAGGAMLHTAVSWGRIRSKYDALLAANFNPNYPEDRWVMFTRCRAWLVYQGFSQDINLDCLQTFASGDRGGGYWRYKVPSGQGEHVLLTIGLEMLHRRNAIRIDFYRHPSGRAQGRLADQTPVRLILRPDIENRSFHDTTKAFAGPEHHFRNSIRPAADGFSFQPDAYHHLRVQAPSSRFVTEPQWEYMIFHDQDAERGQDPHSDLFSPGYFEASLTGGQTVSLLAEASPSESASKSMPNDLQPQLFPLESIMPSGWHPLEMLEKAIDHYLVERGGLKTVIAGYPWFLDWGRDSLIVARGLVAARRFKDARAVLRLFGQYEDRGTLPNMIRGADIGNRETSDAPLWFAVACSDLAAAEGGQKFLKSDCGGRTVKQVVASIAQAYIEGAPNGVRMDSESGLIYSPSHYTWMDTNFPAASPRQGYPVEIQALWYATLAFMARIDSKGARRWRSLAETVQKSIMSLFWQPSLSCFADCLHAMPGQGAKYAHADDHLRPNQLLAITLGAVADTACARQILNACEALLVPGAIRSLADRSVTHALPVYFNNHLLNDPYRPYWGRYSGDEDTSRKPAYHNGTAWTWPFPAYCEAWAMTYGKQSCQTALAWLTSSLRLLESGCIGHLPEILEGNYPHTPCGCDAQAWGASEWVRVWLKLAE
jgi:predicted glycogen debranching enzyme